MTKTTLTVSQLNEYVKTLIGSSAFLSNVCIRGEITNFKRHYQSGHLYFSLKDENAKLNCVMFASSAQKLNFEPRDNMSVLVSGRISVYERDGVYQLYASSMEQAGLGELYAAFEKLKAQLAARGYFDEAHKKPIPRFPQKIGIITSPVGAAVADMKNILERRYPVADIYIYPALVQGEGAAEDLCRGIRYFDGQVDVILIGRGGGSIEDLWCFNHKDLAEAIYRCETPVISAVGHEIDFTICDFVADLRAPTPSAAAELCVPDKKDLADVLTALSQRLTNDMLSLVRSKATLRDGYAAKACFVSPAYFTDRRKDELQSIVKRSAFAYSKVLSEKRQSLAAVSARLAALNPMQVLSRGYAAVYDKNGDVVTSAEAVNKEDALRLVMKDGTVNVRVTDKEVHHG